MKNQLYEIWPDLKQYESKTHYIYAAIESTRNFPKRSIKSVVKEIRNAIRHQGKSKFVFLGHEEALIIQSIIKIHMLVDILGDEIKPNDFYFTTSSINGSEAYKNLCDRLGYANKKITILSCHGFERAAQRGLKGIFEDTDVEPSPNKEKLFLSFNKVNREHRMWLLESMLSADLVKDAFYSFEGEGNWIESVLKSDEYPNIKKNINLFPLRLNITPDRTNPVDIVYDDIKYHKNSYFSVVTETIFFDNTKKSIWHNAHVEDSIFFTEKTYKCFALKHPFILLGRPHCLAELRKSGYRTFAPFIDESYDLIDNDRHRFQAVIKEIKRLCNFTKEQWNEWSKNVKEIIDHNHKHFYSRKTYDASPIKDYFSDVDGCDAIKPIYLNNSAPDYVKLISTDVDKNWNLLTRKLSGDITVTFPIHLDGGGQEMKDELVSVIRTMNRVYNKCYEWCCGFGVLGYEIYGNGLAKSLAFSDYYDVAVKNCLDTAVLNKMVDKVVGYVTPAVKNLPTTEKFDLVVSNPPHMFNKQEYEDVMDPAFHSYIGNSARLLVDDDFGIHKEFFTNIRKNLTDDADLFIIESNMPDKLNDMIEDNGFEIVNLYPISFGQPHSKIMHIKLKNRS